MSLQDLIKAAQSTVVDQKKLDELKGRLEQADKKFESLSASSNEFLSRRYSL